MMKRIFDFLASLIGIILISPFLLILALLVRIKMGSPVLFKQKRTGKGGQIFELWKFRSMTNETDENGNLLPNEQRMTPFGTFLRHYSLDEFPGLFNVLKGEMSLVGPRPLLPEYMEYYTEEQSRRHEVKPGITGWTQINGRNALTWDEKFELDLWYVENQSFWLDLKILFKTVFKVIKKEDITHEGSVAMPRFDEWGKGKSEKGKVKSEKGKSS
ncbi:MAG: sugar transferase [Balneolaceae bacterium]|nr:sugar transferase [Balneolaceae bacterium]